MSPKVSYVRDFHICSAVQQPTCTDAQGLSGHCRDMQIYRQPSAAHKETTHRQLTAREFISRGAQQVITQNFSLGGGGVGTDPEGVYIYIYIYIYIYKHTITHIHV